MIRDQLEQRLPDLTNGEWSLLEDDGHVAEVESGASDVTHLAERVERLRQATSERATQEPATKFAVAEDLARRASTRAEALSAVLAAKAARDADVVAFRRELRGRLLKPERVGAWVQRHAGPPTQLVTIAAERPDEPLHYFFRVLEYADPPSTVVQRIRVPVDSTLDRLRALSESLAERYAWQPAQASVFVVTGLVPILPPVRARTKIRPSVSAATRIRLDIDPTVTPREVAERYAAVRKQLLPGRSRRMSEKHLRLAIYAATHSEGTWAERMREWNAANPDESYSEPSNFQRDAANAVKRLLTPPMNQAREQGKGP